MSMQQRLLKEGGAWVGQGRALNVREFRHSFGVYPRTVAHIAQMGLAMDVGITWLLKTLWWLKVYPTDVEIIHHKASATHFREKLWRCLSVLKDSLPEVLGSEHDSYLLACV